MGLVESPELKEQMEKNKPINVQTALLTLISFT